MGKPKKRPDGRYRVQIYLGRDDTGKAKYKSIYAKNLAELKEKETAVRHELGKGIDLMAGRDSFAQWADDWLRLKESEHISDRQMDHYRVAVRWWKEQFAGLEILEVRPDDIEHGLVNLVERGLSSRTIAFYRSTIRQIMERATDRVISFNPERKVRVTQRIGKKTEPRRALTEEEQRWIWETPHRGQPVAIIMMLSGLRRGELTALTWDDIDTEKRQITVNKAVAYLSDGTPVMKDAKSTAGMRVIDIPGKLCEYLDQIPRDDHLVVHTKAGGLMTESAWVKLWAGYMRLLNAKYGAGILTHEDEPGRPGPKTYKMTIPPITMHWLRHTFCTLMYLAGVDVITASKQMGHADVATTLRIYTHLDEQYKRKSVDKLDAYIEGKF